MPIAYAYSRYSSAAQAEGDSLRRQLKASFEFAEKFGLDLDTTLQDHGVSAYTGLNRIKGALGSFIDRVKAGEIERGSYFLVDSLDRFSRESETQVLNMLTGLTLAGIKVVNLAEEHVLDETADAVDFLRVLIHASRSKQESDEKSRKVRLARAEERARARAMGTPFTPIAPHWLKLVVQADGVKGWEIQKDRVEVIQRIFDMKEQGLGNAYIAKAFNHENVRTPKPPRKKAGEPRGTSGRWFNTTVADIASSRAVLGEYQPFTGHPHGAKRLPDGEPIASFYPAIIDEGQFNRVQVIIGGKKNPNAKPATKAFRNLLIGLCECESCGGVVGYAQSTFPRQPTWKPKGFLRCNGVARGICNNKTRIASEPLEAELLAFVAGMKLTDEAPNTAALAGLLDAEGERLALQTKIDALLDNLEQGGVAVLERLRQRQAEMALLDRRAGDLRRAVAQERDAAPVVEVLDEIGRLTAKMRNAEGADLYAVRARIHAGLKQVVRGGFVLCDGFIKARFKPERLDRKPLFYWGQKGGVIRWQTDPAAPSHRITGTTVVVP
ncbi:MAG: recombinase family protein [Cypionkella sp.]